MSNASSISISSRRRGSPRRARSLRVVFPAWLLATGVGLLLAAAGCGDSGAVRVELQAYAPLDVDARRLEIRAQVTGRTAGLAYKWFSVVGECQPQESEWPSTTYKFGSAMRDVVTVELWREGKRVARDEIEVEFDENRAPRVTEPLPAVEVEITTIPPYQPEGGPHTRADIGGKVSGEFAAENKVVIYARADAWYIQPSAYALHPIAPDGHWESWTHTGSSYAALVVRPGFDPFLRLDVLPQVGGYVLARAIVEGTRE